MRNNKSEFTDLFNDEFIKLSEIGNTFRISSHEIDQKDNPRTGIF